jgi:hypothetical protein
VTQVNEHMSPRKRAQTLPATGMTHTPRASVCPAERPLPKPLARASGSIFNKPARRGIIGAELAVSLALLMGLAVLTVDAVTAYRHTEQESFWRRAALLAADAQLQRYHAGAPLDSQPPQGLIAEEIVLETRKEPAHGQWEGLTRVTVFATVHMPNGKVVHEQLSAYVRAERQP